MADIRTELEQRPMNAFQIFVVSVMVFLNGLDGFDVLAMTFAGQVIRPEWGISDTTFGTLISAGLVGMMAGSLLIAPFADRFGRRNLTLIALVLVTVGMFASALTTGPWQMGFWRVVTGLGIGTMLASIASFTAEYSNARNRSLSISIMAIGYPAGGTLGGLVAAELVAATGAWQPIFIFGGLCSLVVIPLIWFFIPDSMDFLITRKPKNALQKANRLLPRLGMAPISELPAAHVHETDVKIYKVLLSNHLASTLKITITYFLFAGTLYFALGWVPGILTDAGLTATQGISGAVVLNGGGVLGGILFGMVAGKWGGLRNTIPFFMGLGFLFFVAFGFVPTNLLWMLALSFAMGFCLIAIVSGLYSTYPVIFPPTVRTTGTGIVIGVGRIGGILSPIIAGMMFDSNITRAVVCIVMALPLIVGLIILRTIPELKSAKARGKVEVGGAH